MTDDQLDILKEKLARDFVPHLPPLIDNNKPQEHLDQKNVARAFSAFALQKISKLDHETAAKAVVDDYEDNGIDAIHYHQPSKRLFLLQGKLRANEPFGQDEANAFCRGVSDLLNERFVRFNKNVADRQAELDAALDEASEIILIVAHAGDLISEHAKRIISDFLKDEDRPDERLCEVFIDFGPARVVEELLDEQQVPPAVVP